MFTLESRRRDDHAHQVQESLARAERFIPLHFMKETGSLSQQKVKVISLIQDVVKAYSEGAKRSLFDKWKLFIKSERRHERYMAATNIQRRVRGVLGRQEARKQSKIVKAWREREAQRKAKEAARLKRIQDRDDAIYNHFAVSRLLFVYYLLIKCI